MVEEEKYYYGDIPAEEERKIYFPMNRNVMRIIKILGYDYYLKYLDNFFQDAKMLSSFRCKETVLTMKECIEGRLPEPSKVLAYSLFPPIWVVRTDLHAGTTSLLFGESVISSFSMIHEERIIFCHIIAADNGVPLNFWFYDSDDDLMEMFHPRYSVRFNKLPTVIKRPEKLGFAISTFLKEHSEFASLKHAQLVNCLSHGEIVLNCLVELSNFEVIGALFDNLSTSQNKLPEPAVNFMPYPFMLKNYLSLGRKSYVKRLSGLTTDGKLYLQPLLQHEKEWISEKLPELFDLIWNKGYDRGIPFPFQSVNLMMPKFPDYEKGLSYKYPEGDFLSIEDANLSKEEAIKGVYFNYGLDDRGPIDEKRIISVGHGRNTRFY
ncbi:MAG: hypothetical protein ACTSRW_04565 [Candidatus Helarchaeota archaeon]